MVLLASWQTVRTRFKSRVTAAWAKEGLVNAQEHVYLNGKLAVANDPNAIEIPSVPDDYAANAGRVSRVCVAKAGVRLNELIATAID